MRSQTYSVHLYYTLSGYLRGIYTELPFWDIDVLHVTRVGTYILRAPRWKIFDRMFHTVIRRPSRMRLRRRSNNVLPACENPCRRLLTANNLQKQILIIYIYISTPIIFNKYAKTSTHCIYNIYTRYTYVLIIIIILDVMYTVGDYYRLTYIKYKTKYTSITCILK